MCFPDVLAAGCHTHTRSPFLRDVNLLIMLLLLSLPHTHTHVRDIYDRSPDFDKRVERLRKMCISESDLDSVLSAFLLANDMDVIATEMTGLTINQANGKGGSNNGSRIGDPESGKKKNKDKKDKKREKVIKSATLRLPHFKSKEKAAATAAAGDSLSSSSSPSNKGKSSTLRTIKKLGGGLRVKSPNSSSNKSATGSNREKE